MSWIICPDEKNGLLDLYPGAAAAYSVRNLNGRSGVSSPVVRVRRSSDNTEQDFTAEQVTDGTLTTFCGAGDGFVRTWYDQSGNINHVSQAVSSSQPKIVNSGNLILENTKPVISFDGSNDWLFIDATTPSIGFPTGSSFLISLVRSVLGAGSQIMVSMGDAPFRINDWYIQNSVTLMIGNTSGNYFLASSELPLSSAQGLATFSCDGTTMVGYGNGATGTSVGYQNTVGSTRLQLGRYASSTYFNGYLQELIIYRSNQSTNRTAIEANINAHYSIF